MLASDSGFYQRTVFGTHRNLPASETELAALPELAHDSYVTIGVAAPMAFLPFGGSKTTFSGELKAQGREAISFFTDQRVVISRW